MARSDDTRRTVGRRAFTRLLGGGAAAALVRPWRAFGAPGPVAPAPPNADEGYWRSVRAQFLLRPDLVVMNAANLCPSPRAVVEAVEAATRDMDADPSMQNRRKLAEARERTRRQLAEFLRVTPEDIIITRNTSEANNLVSSGLALGPGDEVVIFSDNHPSNHAAWREKAKRFGFTVRTVEQVNPHPGAEYYIDAFTRALTPRTKVLALTHITSTVGDILPIKELCRVARERDVLTLVDGAQSFGVLDVDLSDLQPDFYTGSAHKWPCGPKEVGVLYVNRRAQPALWASILSAYPGAVGLSRTFEGFGQRDEPAMVGFGEALAFQTTIGRAAIEQRARELTAALIQGLRRIDGVRLWTHGDPARSGPVVSFQPGSLDPARLAAALYTNEAIACAVRGGRDRPGLRFSPHLYNLHDEVDRVLAAIRKYMRTGL